MLKSYHNVINEPNPAPGLNTVETFDVKWITSRGRKNGNSRGSVLAARQLANKVEAEGATNISITRRWIAGHAF